MNEWGRDCGGHRRRKSYRCVVCGDESKSGECASVSGESCTLGRSMDFKRHRVLYKVTVGAGTAVLQTRVMSASHTGANMAEVSKAAVERKLTGDANGELTG